jgi:hypothetical protein
VGPLGQADRVTPERASPWHQLCRGRAYFLFNETRDRNASAVDFLVRAMP